MSFKVVLAAIFAITLAASTSATAATIATGAAGVNAIHAADGVSGDRIIGLPTPRPETTVLPSFNTAPPPRLGVFRSVAISAARLPAAVKWQTARAKDQTALFGTNCDALGAAGCDTHFARKVQAVAGKVAGLSDRGVLDLVNRTVNGAMRYEEDTATWGTGDYWATPGEMAIKGAGDCEDFVIGKYWLLRSLGMADDQMQVVVLQDTRRRLFHAVLVVHTASGAYVLDNVSNRLETDTAYGQYQPIMSFAGARNFIHGFAAGTRSTTAMPSDLSAVSPGSGM